MIAPTQKVRVALSLGIFIVTILLGFQNCMELPEQELPQTSKTTTDFPYQFKADTFGFMSCDNMTDPDQEAYFTVRAGALKSTAGLSYSSKFYDYAHSKGRSFTENYLNQSPYGGTRLQLAVRARANLTGSPRGPSSIPSNQLPYRLWDAFALSSDPVLYELYSHNTTSPLLAFPGSGVTHSRLIGQVTFNQYSLATTQTELGTTSYVTFGFQKSGDPYGTANIFSPIDIGDTQSVGIYGAGFAPGFMSPTLYYNGNPIQVAHGPRVLMSLSQFNMSTYSYFPGETNWSCPSYAQYRVVTYDQATAAGCQTNPQVPAAGSAAYTAWEAAHALLDINGTSNWIVDQTNRCIIRNTNTAQGGRAHPAGKSLCYVNPANVGWGLDANGNSTCGGSTGKVCPHYFSMCAPYLPASL